MRKKTMKVVKSDNILPPIKTKTMISMRSSLNKSPVPEGMSSPRLNEVPGQSDQSKQFINRGVNLNLNKKVNNLLKIIKEQDEKIKSIESELKIHSQSSLFKPSRAFASSLNTNNPSEMNSFIEHGDQIEGLELEADEKNLEEFYIQAAMRDKQKDIVIFKLKKQIEEDTEKIQTIIQQRGKFKQKLAEMLNAQQVILKSEEEINQIKDKCKGQVADIEGEMAQKEYELKERVKDFEELAELLQKSEEKRQYSNEYNIFMESNEHRLKEKVKALEMEKEKLFAQIVKVQQQIVDQENVLNELEKSAQDLQMELEKEKEKTDTLEFNLGLAEDALTESLNQHKFQEKKFEADLNYLEQQIDFSRDSESTDKTGNRNLDLSEKHFITDFSKEETIKLRQKYNRVEKDLAFAREALERLKKNEIYLQNQFITKDLMITQIEKMLISVEMNREQEEKQKKIEEDKKKEEEKKKTELAKSAKNSVAELQNIIKDMIESYGEQLVEVKCVKCLKTAVDCVLLVPCGHLACSACWGLQDDQCVLCGKSASVLKSKNLSKVIGRLRMDSETIMKANKLLS